MELYFSAFWQSVYSLPKDWEKLVNMSEMSICQTFCRAETRMKKNLEKQKEFKNYLLDSGAFSIMMNPKSSQKFEIMDYTEKYAKFIKENNIEDFIELDIDSIYGINVYIDCLHKLQDITGKNPIKVFHMWRGKDYFLELVKKEKRIAISRIASAGNSNKLKESDFILINDLIQIAHDNNCKVHGLGITGSAELRKYNFDSIDSSSWNSGVRSGSFCRFDGHSINVYKNPGDYKLDGKIYALNGFLEWKKYSDYLLKL